MSQELPEFLSPWQAVTAQARFAGSLPVARFQRLRESLVDGRGTVRYGLHFGYDADARPRLQGWVKARLRLRCQRCLEVVEYALSPVLDLVLVSGIEEARRVPDAQDPLLVGDQAVRSLELLEDELILALPQIPKHALGTCTNPWIPERPDGIPDVHNPFSALKDWNPS